MLFEKIHIGVDIGTSSLKVVKLLSSRKEIKLLYTSLTEFNFVNGERNKSQILEKEVKEVLKEGDLSEHKISVNFSDKNPIIKYISLPKLPMNEIEDAVKWEVKKLISVPMETLVLDFLILGEIEEQNIKKYEIMIVAADKKILSDQVNLLKGFGLKIGAVDVTPLSILNSIRLNNKEDLNSNIAFIDIGASKIEINIIKNGALKFTRNIAVGGDEITRQISKELSIDDEEAEELKIRKGIGEEADETLKKIIKKQIDNFILETQRSIDYYRAQLKQGDINKIILMGGTPLLPGFKDYFASYFENRVVVDDPFSNIKLNEDISPELRGMSSRFTPCVGLALRNN